MFETYHVRIKKDYVSAILKDLEKMDALEMLPDSEVPEWHMQIVSERLEEYKKHPGIALDFEAVMNEIEQDI